MRNELGGLISQKGGGEMKDMTKRAFLDACKRRGFKGTGFLGYFEIGNGVSVSVLNAGPTRREQLAYLIQAANRAQATREAGEQNE